ncbi:MAG: hypothetical protein WCF78_02150 [archaeon]
MPQSRQPIKSPNFILRLNKKNILSRKTKTNFNERKTKAFNDIHVKFDKQISDLQEIKSLKEIRKLYTDNLDSIKDNPKKLEAYTKKIEEIDTDLKNIPKLLRLIEENRKKEMDLRNPEIEQKYKEILRRLKAYNFRSKLDWTRGRSGELVKLRGGIYRRK